MTVAMLRGATAVRKVVGDYLAATVPSVVAMARADWGVDEIQLPLPVAYDAYEPSALDKWPLLGITVANAGNFNRVNYYPDMSQQYVSQYVVRVYTWVRTPMDENEYPIEPEYSNAIRLRDDLAACVRTSLLLTGNLGNPSVHFDEGSLTEDYSETEKVKGGRYVSGVAHGFSMTYYEVAPNAAVGHANSIVLTGHSMNEAFVTNRARASLTVVCNVS